MDRQITNNQKLNRIQQQDKGYTEEKQINYPAYPIQRAPEIKPVEKPTLHFLDLKVIVPLLILLLLIIGLGSYFYLSQEPAISEEPTISEPAQLEGPDVAEETAYRPNYESERLWVYNFFASDLPEWELLGEVNYGLEYYDEFSNLKEFKKETGFVKGNVRVFQISNLSSLDYKRLTSRIESYRNESAILQTMQLEQAISNKTEYLFSTNIRDDYPNLRESMEYSRTVEPSKTIAGKTLTKFTLAFIRFNKFVELSIESYENSTEELRSLALQINDRVFYPAYKELGELEIED